MIEIFRKGFRLDINPQQIITFKKSQNLNGIQERYAYSNTIPLDKTANNKKLLELFDLPTNKVSSLMNGYEVDVVLNGSIQLRNQTLKIQKESLDKIDTYLLYSDNALVIKLKEQYLNAVTSGFLYKKTVLDFVAKSTGTTSRTAFVETQDKSGLFVIEEMPILLQLQEVIKLIFTQNNYGVFGDFFVANNDISQYYISPNQGKYQVYDGVSAGFVPNFDPNLNAFDFLSQTLAFFNCYAEVDDTYKTVVINRWTNLDQYKTNYVDYSKYFVNYTDYTFQSKLAKRNEMTYSDSGSLFNSFFPNNLSGQDKAVYLNSAFGAGSLMIFDDSDIQDDLTIPVRANGSVGEISAVRIFKISSYNINSKLYVNGNETSTTNKKALSVSMLDVYNSFHKDYTDFILTPLIVNIQFKYDTILAAEFSLTKVFFIEQLSSYWIPLEVNFSTKKDLMTVKAMLIKKRKVPSPTLNNFNSVFLDFKEKAFFPLAYLNSMYPMPPNEYPWDVVIFRSYDQNKNTLYVNDIAVPALTLPQAFSLADIVSIKFEANKPSDTLPDTNTDSLYLQAIDTNGGVSNEAYITIKHTGLANFESNFNQPNPFLYSRNDFDAGNIWVNLATYYVGLKPNINNTVTSADLISNSSGPNDTFNLIQATQTYGNIKVKINPFTIFLRTENNGIGKARAYFQLYIDYNGLVTPLQLLEVSTADNQSKTVVTPQIIRTIPSLASGGKIRVYGYYRFDNRRGLNSGSMDVETQVTNFSVDISTTVNL
jgi:hypothetical protein